MTTATLTSVLDTLGVFLGGPYDSARRLYGNPGAPVVPGLYAVKRGDPTDTPSDLWDYGSANPPTIGCWAVLVPDDNPTREYRVALGGATSGLKKVEENIELRAYLRGAGCPAEDVRDAQVALKDALTARIRSDRTCGSGGFELGGFQVAETEPWLRFTLSKVRTSTGLSKATLIMLFEAHYYVQA